MKKYTFPILVTIIFVLSIFGQLLQADCGIVQCIQEKFQAALTVNNDSYISVYKQSEAQSQISLHVICIFLLGFWFYSVSKKSSNTLLEETISKKSLHPKLRKVKVFFICKIALYFLSILFGSLIMMKNDPGIGLSTFIGTGILLFLDIMSVILLIFVIRGLQKSQKWAWIVAIIFSVKYIFSILIPFAIMSLFALFNKDVMKSFESKTHP